MSGNSKKKIGLTGIIVRVLAVILVVVMFIVPVYVGVTRLYQDVFQTVDVIYPTADGVDSVVPLKKEMADSLISAGLVKPADEDYVPAEPEAPEVEASTGVETTTDSETTDSSTETE